MGLFVKVGTTRELEALEAGKLVEAGGQRIAIFNVGGKYWAIEDTCPHRGGPLSEGMLAEDEVICPWHGSRFNLKTGAVLTPPAQRNVKSFSVRIVGTDVEVEIE
jgi:3-phenylpropionate/trans-cinnamate dioxygenase ferredoxin subunit